MSDDPISIRPRFRPRNAGDALLSVVVIVPYQLTVLFILPSLVAYLLTRSIPAAVGAPTVIYVVFLAFTVTNLTISAEGLRFHRRLGFPKLLPWADITSIELASQRELVLKGWLWPLLPAREMTPSLSSIGHYRISWVGGFCYYPPRDAEQFEKRIHAYFPRTEA